MDLAGTPPVKTYTKSQKRNQRRSLKRKEGKEMQASEDMEKERRAQIAVEKFTHCVELIGEKLATLKGRDKYIVYLEALRLNHSFEKEIARRAAIAKEEQLK